VKNPVIAKNEAISDYHFKIYKSAKISKSIFHFLVKLKKTLRIRIRLNMEIEMNRSNFFLFMLSAIMLTFIACSFSSITGSSGIGNDLDQTKTALVIQQTSVSLQQTQISQNNSPLVTDTSVAAEQPTFTPYPTFTSPAVIVVQPTYTPYPTYTIPPSATSQPPTLQPTVSFTDTPTAYFQSITVDRKVFYCVPSDGPTTLKVTVQLSDVDLGAGLYWRLSDKTTGRITDWEYVKMERIGGNQRSFTFDADVWTGTNNFYYPSLMGESWFEFQIISNDNQFRTDVISEVTFFPCAQ
jgi:hypothetical protein